MRVTSVLKMIFKILSSIYRKACAVFLRSRPMRIWVGELSAVRNRGHTHGPGKLTLWAVKAMVVWLAVVPLSVPIGSLLLDIVSQSATELMDMSFLERIKSRTWENTKTQSIFENLCFTRSTIAESCETISLWLDWPSLQKWGTWVRLDLRVFRSQISASTRARNVSG